MAKIFEKINYPNLKVVNTDTGEIVSSVTKVSCGTLSEFIMFFFKGIPLCDRLGGNALKILMRCWKESAPSSRKDEGNMIHNDADFKRKVIEESGKSFTPASIDNAFFKLRKAGLLIRVCKGKYMLNKDYFYKGKLTKSSNLELE